MKNITPKEVYLLTAIITMAIAIHVIFDMKFNKPEQIKPKPVAVKPVAVKPVKKVGPRKHTATVRGKYYDGYDVEYDVGYDVYSHDSQSIIFIFSRQEIEQLANGDLITFENPKEKPKEKPYAKSHRGERIRMYNVDNVRIHDWN